MAMSGFEAFKSRRTNLNEKILQSQEKKNYDDGSWKLEVDNDKGVGEAIIRFLPPKETDLPYVKYYQHFFKGDDGNWCIVDKCPRTFNETCTVNF